MTEHRAATPTRLWACAIGLMSALLALACGARSGPSPAEGERSHGIGTTGGVQPVDGCTAGTRSLGEFSQEEVGPVLAKQGQVLVLEPDARAIGVVDRETGAQRLLALDFLGDSILPRCLELADELVYLGTSDGDVLSIPLAGGSPTWLRYGQGRSSTSWCALSHQPQGLYYLEPAIQTLWLINGTTSLALATGVAAFVARPGVAYTLGSGVLHARQADGGESTLLEYGVQAHPFLWFSQGSLYFPGFQAPIERISASGGTREVVLGDSSFDELGGERQLLIANQELFLGDGTGALWRANLDGALPVMPEVMETRGAFDDDDYQQFLAADELYVYWFSGIDLERRVDADWPLHLFATCRQPASDNQ